MASRKQHGKATQIAGFRKVETHLAGFWKASQDGQAIRGVVGEAVQVKGREDDKPNTFYTLQLTSVEVGGSIRTSDDKVVKPEVGMMIGIGGKMLLSFLRGREGREVMLIYRGLGPKKAGQNPAKLYDTYEREETDE